MLKPATKMVCVAGNTARSLPQDISIQCGSPNNRLIVDLVEYRKGYHYSVSFFEGCQPRPYPVDMNSML